MLVTSVSVSYFDKPDQGPSTPTSLFNLNWSENQAQISGDVRE